MGDTMQNFEIFKKLGFDNSNQWIFYDEKFQKLFNFFTEYITDENILTENEVLEQHELKERKECLDSQERGIRLTQLEQDNPGLNLYTEYDVQALTQEISDLEQTANEYATLVEDMRTTKHETTLRLSKLEDNHNGLLKAEEELLKECQTKSKQLEGLQRENSILCIEATNRFTKIQSPPLFVHQLPLEQYLLKCDSFMQYLTLYVKENFKIQDFSDLDGNNSQITEKLDKLAKSMQHYTFEYIKEKSKGKAMLSLIESLDLKKMHLLSVSDMKRETHDMQMLNEHHLKNAKETLMNDLEMHIHQCIQQRMELILYENTKEKLERAHRRHANDTRLTKIVSDALSNAELIWIAMQLDLEKKRNRYDNTEQLSGETKTCLRRINIMKQLKVMPNKAGITATNLVEMIAEQLSQHLQQQVRGDTKACLYESEKFCRLLAYSQQGMLNGKSYSNTMAQITELKQLESSLRPLVYDSPVMAPMFEDVQFLRPIFEAKMQQNRTEKELRNLRTQFMEIKARLEKDKFFRYNQLLWTWFLTEPQRILVAIEEAKKAASNVPSMTGLKLFGGIKRK